MTKKDWTRSDFLNNIFFRFNRERKAAFIETIKYCTIILAIMILAQMNMLFQIGLLIVPSIFAVIVYRNGLAFALISASIVSLGAAVFMDPLGGAYLTGTLAGAGLVIGEFSYRIKKPSIAIFGGAIMVILNILIMMLLESYLLNVDIIDYIMGSYSESVEIQQQLASIDMDMSTFLINLRRTFPSMVVCMGFIMSSINYFFAGNILMRLTKKRETALFSEFTLPGNIFGGILIIYGLTAMLLYSDFIYKETLILNITIIFGMLFLLQGFATVYHFLFTRMKPLPRHILMCMLFIFMPLYTFVITIGFIDAVLNLRKLKR